MGDFDTVLSKVQDTTLHGTYNHKWYNCYHKFTCFDHVIYTYLKMAEAGAGGTVLVDKSYD